MHEWNSFIRCVSSKFHFSNNENPQNFQKTDISFRSARMHRVSNMPLGTFLHFANICRLKFSD